MQIPKQLQNPNYRFILVEKGGKKPVELNWQTTANYTYDDPKLLEHIKNGGNLGILTGYGVVILDCDDQRAENIANKLLPPTFTVGTSTTPEGYRKKHKYYRCQLKEKKILFDYADHLGEVQALGQQCLIPGSVRPDVQYQVLEDRPIAEVTQEEILKAISPFVKNEKVTEFDLDSIRNGTKEGNRNEAAFKLATFHRKAGASIQETLELLLVWNQKNQPPLEEFELENVLKSAYGKSAPYNVFFKQSPFQVNITKPELVYFTDHLPYFNCLDILLPLKGKVYKPLKKLFYRSLVGAILRKNVSFGQVEADTRLNPLIFLPPGHGKNEIGNFLSDSFNNLHSPNLTFEQPTSSHPEQLVGKNITVDFPDTYTTKTGLIRQKTKKIKKQNPGKLAETYVLFDEASKMLLGEKDEDIQARNYIKRATSTPIGRNFISKRAVDDQKNETLTYTPDVSIGILTQPVFLKESLAGEGFLRRFVGLHLQTKHNTEREDNYTERLDGIDQQTLEKAKNDFYSFLRNLLAFRDYELKFTQDFKDRFVQLFKELVAQVKSHSKKARNYLLSLDYTLQNQLLAAACLQALITHKKIVDVEDLELGYIDTVEFLQGNLDFLDKFILGDLDYGLKWKGASQKDRECLTYLLESNALSLDTSKITCEEYQKVICDIFNVGTERARKIYLKHRSNHWLKSKQRQHDGLVWLGFIPSDDDDFEVGQGGCDFLEYFKILKKVKDKKNNFYPKNDYPPDLPGSESIIKAKILAQIERFGNQEFTLKTLYEKMEKLAVGQYSVDNCLDDLLKEGILNEQTPGVFKKT